MELAEVEDAGTDVTITKSGATILGRTAGRANLARAIGAISLVRTALRATLAFLHYRRHQEGMMTTIKTRGLGASRSRVQSPASWAAPSPQPLSASSNSSLAR